MAGIAHKVPESFNLRMDNTNDTLCFRSESTRILSGFHPDFAQILGVVCSDALVLPYATHSETFVQRDCHDRQKRTFRDSR